MSDRTGAGPVHQVDTIPYVTLREFEITRESQVKLEDERALRVAEARLAMERLIDARLLHLKAEVEAKFTAEDKARSLDRADTQKHLEQLNGEQARLLADRERMISREKYEADQHGLAEWKDSVNGILSLGRGREKGISLAWVVIVGLAGLISTLVAIFSHKP